MSYLFYSLNTFGFSSLEEVTASSLKRAFKKRAVVYHPDRGGSDNSFDDMLGSYLYLCETIHRLNGGRHSLQIVDAPEQLKQQRATQYMNELFDELVIESEDNSKPLPDDFHDRFLAEHVNLDAHGYDTWFKSDADQIAFKPHIGDGDMNIVYGDIVANAIGTPIDDFHAVFEKVAVTGKPPPTQTIMLHPDDMGCSTYSGGSSLIKSTTFTSESGLRPEYCDLHEAFTSENTVYDKLSVPITERTLTDDALAALVKIREEVYTCSADADVEAMAAYEKQKIDEQTEHKKKLDSYFKKGVFLKDSEVVKNEVIMGDVTIMHRLI
jgi:hypothetical protein